MHGAQCTALACPVGLSEMTGDTCHPGASSAQGLASALAPLPLATCWSSSSLRLLWVKIQRRHKTLLHYSSMTDAASPKELYHHLCVSPAMTGVIGVIGAEGAATDSAGHGSWLTVGGGGGCSTDVEGICGGNPPKLAVTSPLVASTGSMPIRWMASVTFCNSETLLLPTDCKLSRKLRSELLHGFLRLFAMRCHQLFQLLGTF